jgi:hypothetical protein
VGAEERSKRREESARLERDRDGIAHFASAVILLGDDRPRLVLQRTWFPDKGAATEAVLDALSLSDEQIMGFPYGFG